MVCGVVTTSDDARRATRTVTEGPTVKIVAYNKQYRITLPKDLVRDKGWDAGTELRFVEDENGRIYLKELGDGQ